MSDEVNEAPSEEEIDDFIRKFRARHRLLAGGAAVLGLVLLITGGLLLPMGAAHYSLDGKIAAALLTGAFGGIALGLALLSAGLLTLVFGLRSREK